MRRSRPDAVPRLEEVVVLALAAARLARVISTDDITDPARRRLGDWAAVPGSAAWRAWFERLVHCPICTGWWTSLGVSLVAPGRHRLLRGIAVAGGQVLITLSERLVSEEGRAAIHHANQAAVADPVADIAEPVEPG